MGKNNLLALLKYIGCSLLIAFFLFASDQTEAANKRFVEKCLTDVQQQNYEALWAKTAPAYQKTSSKRKFLNFWKKNSKKYGNLTEFSNTAASNSYSYQFATDDSDDNYRWIYYGHFENELTFITIDTRKQDLIYGIYIEPVK